MDKDKVYVSYYENCTARTSKKLLLSDFLEAVKTGQIGSKNLLPIITQLRAEPNDEKQQGIKKRKLPAITLSSICKNGHLIEGVISHTGFLQVDFDDKGIKDVIDAEVLKETLKKDPHTYACFISPRGKGVKQIVKIPPVVESHDSHFESYETYVKQKYNIGIDRKPKRVNALFYYSYDPEIFINKKSKVYVIDHTVNNAGNAGANRLSLPLAPGEFKNNPIAHPKDVDECWGFTEQRQGYYEGNRNEFLLWFAGNCNRAGIALNECLNFSYQKCSPLPPQEIKATVESAYKNIGEHGKHRYDEAKAVTEPLNNRLSYKNIHGEEITDRERVENSIMEIFEIRRNKVLDRVECKKKNKDGAKWESANEDNISRELELKRVKNCGPNRIKSIMNCDFVRSFNPFENYFENLPSYNKREEPDYISLLSGIVKLKNEEADRERFNKHLRKALVRCVACSLGNEVNNLHYNKHAIIFISPKQSIGKSGFIRFLIPKDLELYCIEKMTFGDRDEQFAMQSSFIINLDEMATIDEKNFQKVKSAMSTGVINVRKINSGNRIIEPRRCNFFGNTNETQILKDDTGSVRWLCFEVDGFNIEKEYWKPVSELYVDINRVWAMAYSLFKEGFEFQLTPKDLQENETANEQYKEASLEEQLLKMTFQPAPKSKEYHKQTAEILNLIAVRYPALSKNLNPTKLGSSLKHNGFLYGQEFYRQKGFNTKGYYVMDITN